MIATMEKYRITAENMYNFDEKRFMIGLGQAVKRIMTREELRRGKILGVSKDGSNQAKQIRNHITGLLYESVVLAYLNTKAKPHSPPTKPPPRCSLIQSNRLQEASFSSVTWFLNKVGIILNLRFLVVAIYIKLPFPPFSSPSLSTG